MPALRESSRTTCSQAQTSASSVSPAFGSLHTQRLLSASITVALGRAPPRLEPAATRSRTSASRSSAALSAASRSAGSSTTRGTASMVASRGLPDSSQILIEPCLETSATPTRKSDSSRVRGVSPSPLALLASSLLRRFLPHLSGMASEKALRSEKPSDE